MTTAETRPLLDAPVALNESPSSVCLELSLAFVGETADMQKRYFVYDEALKKKLMSLVSQSSLCDVRPAKKRTDIYTDTPDHRCLTLPHPLWMICRTKHKTSERGEKHVTKFKRVEKNQSIACIKDITLEHAILRRALEEVTHIKKKKFHELITAMFTNSYAAITYTRTKVKIAGECPCTLVFDECHSDYFPHVYRVGFMQFGQSEPETAPMSRELLRSRVPSLLSRHIVMTNERVDTKVMHSLLFSNPYLYSRIQGSTHLIPTTVKHFATVISGLHSVSQRIGRDQSALFKRNATVRKALRLRERLNVLRMICTEAIGRKQHLISMAEFWALDGQVHFDQDWDDQWYNQFSSTCDRVLQSFYSR
jgi:hypothetical protein